MFTVSQTAKLVGISVRTLHYYDEIGLVPPTSVTEAGYRLYDDDAVSLLQQVLFWRELELPLDEIAKIVTAPDYDKAEVLQKHRTLLLLKKKHLDELLLLADELIGGKINMKNHNETTEKIAEAKAAYAAEAERRWGDTDAFKQSKNRHESYTSEKEAAIAADADDIFRAFAAKMDLRPDDPAVQALVERWQAHITKYHYNCTKEILAGLGQMYTADVRFTENLDRFGDGNAAFMSAAIAAYCAK